MGPKTSVGWVLIVVGLVIAGIGVIWVLVPSVPWLGRLPGDIVIERDGVRFYFPIVTCLLFSLAISALLFLMRLIRG